MSATYIQQLYGIDRSAPLPAEEAFYRGALMEIEAHAVASQLYWLLKQEGKLEKTPGFFRRGLKERFNAGLYLNLFVKSEQEAILAKLEAAGVEVIPLKGVNFAQSYFGHIGARATTDIDLLVQPQDRGKAAACVRELGFNVEEARADGHFHWSFSKPLPHSPIPLTVELHWDLLRPGSSSLPLEPFWEEARCMPGYRHVKELSPYHTFYMICLHGWRHSMDSMKYVLDIARMVAVLGDDLDCGRLLDEAKRHQTFRRMAWTLGAVYRIFPCLVGIKPFPFGNKLCFIGASAAPACPNDRAVRRAWNQAYAQIFLYDSIWHSVKAIWAWTFR
ncbi:nucleotidyltransferase family protein [Paenibacillus chartarius]|uniref:Nucleotidyltransferase family protein n=1 Tax=Paenibacillus chartarius TaxID=747481 RepID=A0ABV6DUV9_9BACL